LSGIGWEFGGQGRGGARDGDRERSGFCCLDDGMLGKRHDGIENRMLTLGNSQVPRLPPQGDPVQPHSRW
jgi:hypothetical protein